LINYFRYEYPAPQPGEPFSITTEMGTCPWNPEHQLVHIGLQSQAVPTEDLPPSNLVFLIDVSGSMQPANKLPLLKKSFGLLVEQLRPADRVALVVYASASGVVLDSTPGPEKVRILDALERLQAGGSTAGAEGIRAAYRIAEKNFIPGGNNRVILATDGDFNVGISSEGELVKLIEARRDKGIFLTVLGFGAGNIKDNKMEQLADRGNGNYAYIDNLLEGRRELVEEMGATLLTVANDVKLQVEFNPLKIQAYRLIGYENRLLRDRDFNDDTKDAGEMGAGHSVTALYEVIPAGSATTMASVDPLKYQRTEPSDAAAGTAEALTVKVRYKNPGGKESKLLARTLDESAQPLEEASSNLRFAAAVAQFGMLLRDSQNKGTSTFSDAADLGDSAKGADEDGRRSEFVYLAKTAGRISPAAAGLAARR
jgi:Ca-activated chloride channel family protein